MTLDALHRRSTTTRDRLIEWMAVRSVREQRLIAVAATLSAVLVAGYGIVLPIHNARTEAEARIALYAELQARLRAVDPSDGRLRVSSAPLDSVVRDAAAAAGLAGDVSGGGGEASLTVAGARFEAVLAVMSAIEAAGGTIQSFRLSAAGQPGTVDAVLTTTRS